MKNVGDWLNGERDKFGIIYQEDGEWKIWTSNALGPPSNAEPELHPIVTDLFALKAKLVKLQQELQRS